MANKNSLKILGTSKTPINDFVITDEKMVISNADNNGDIMILVSDGSGVTDEDISGNDYRDLYIGDEHIAGGFGFKDITTRNEITENVSYTISKVKEFDVQISNILNTLKTNEYNPIVIDTKYNSFSINNEDYELELDDSNKLKLKHTTKLSINKFKIFFKYDFDQEEREKYNINLLLGDLSNNGILDEEDVNILTTIINGNREKLSELDRIKADVNQNELIESSDLELLNDTIEALKLNNDYNLENLNKIYNELDKEYCLEFNGDDVIINFKNDIILTKIEFDCIGTNPLMGFKLSYFTNNTNEINLCGDIENYTNITNNIYSNFDNEPGENEYYTGKYEIILADVVNNDNNSDINLLKIKSENKEKQIHFKFILCDKFNESVVLYTPKIKMQSPIYFGTINEYDIDIELDEKQSLLINSFDEEVNLNFKHSDINATFGVVYIPNSSFYYNSWSPEFIFNDNVQIKTKWNVSNYNDSNSEINYKKFITPEKYKGDISWILKFK